MQLIITSKKQVHMTVIDYYKGLYPWQSLLNWTTEILICIQNQPFIVDGDDHQASVRQLAMSANKKYSESRNVTEDLAQILHTEAPQSCFLHLYDSKPLPKPPAAICPPTLLTIAENMNIASIELNHLNIDMHTKSAVHCRWWWWPPGIR